MAELADASGLGPGPLGGGSSSLPARTLDFCSAQTTGEGQIVSERLGHASIAITLDTYSHVLPTMQEDAAERVAQLILGSSATGD